jgi:flagellar biosynthesis GTPase FlhF
MPINRFSKTKKYSNTFRQRLKNTNSKKRTNKKRTNKKRTNKKRTNKKRTNKKRTNKKRTNKKRTNKHRVAKKLYQRGGKFNTAEEAQIRDKLKEKGVTDNEKIDSYIEKLGLSSQVFSGPIFEQLTYQLDGVSLEELDDWVNGMGFFEEDVKTDNENTENTDDIDDSEYTDDTN